MAHDATAGLDALDGLPNWYWNVPYVGGRYPGAVPRSDLAEGANCQLWAYEVLGHFGLDVADLRSDQLWEDTTSTRHVELPRPLDLVLYNDSANSYGAHVGVWMGGATAHLCEEVGRPTVWLQSEFEGRARYATRIGFKRPVARPARTRGQ